MERPGTANVISRTIQRYGVFDLETQRSASEVGGWHLAHRMKISCAVVYDSGDDTYSVYHESDVPKLIEHLRQLELVVGFNSKRFDYRVLSGYSDFPFERLPGLDLLEKIHKQLGFRLSLNHLAKQTLQVEKAGSGLDALRWWQQGRLDKIIEYCQMDVKITRDLFLFARDEGYLIYRQKSGDRLRVPISLPLLEVVSKPRINYKGGNTIRYGDLGKRHGRRCAHGRLIHPQRSG